jgi:branched-chain amino acid transport system ATP-binding protein
MSNELLAAAGVAANYGAFNALHGVSINVRRGAFVALIGSNGAGKTTLVKVINGLLRPQAGTVRFDGADMRSCAPHERTRRGVATVAEGRKTFGELTVAENLLAGGTFSRVKAKRLEKLDECYHIFPKLYERRSQLVGTLSGGEQQMVAIGRALMTCPSLLVLDEPSTGLSPRVVADIFHVLKQLAAGGMGILLVEQNVALTLEVAEYAYVLARGELVLEGKAKTLAADPAIRAAYLGI